jgi:hypothetical protein
MTEHAKGGAILDRPTRVEPLGLREYDDAGKVRSEAVYAEKWRISN